MRGDRASVYEQFGRSVADAMANELRHGMVAIRSEAVPGATRFADGAGRHGSFDRAADLDASEASS